VKNEITKVSLASKEYPRVLVLAQNKIQPYTGGGVVLSNLFGEFENNKVMFLHRDLVYDTRSGFNEYRLEGKWLRPVWMTMFGSLVRYLFYLFRAPKKAKLMDFKALLAQSGWFRYPDELDQQIRDFGPEILYAWVSDRLWAETVQKTVLRYQIPYVVHFMDNHIGLEPITPLEKALYPEFLSSLSGVASKAKALYTITNSMGQYYQSLWNRPYEVFHGVIDVAQWPFPSSSQDKETDLDEGFRMVFTGSVEQGQLIGLEDIAQALDTLRREGRLVTLVLYLTESYANRVKPVLGRYECVIIKPHPDFPVLREVLVDADAMVLAYGFNDWVQRYYKYSFATKVVPYMLSGRPILTYGPQGIEPIDYAVKGGWSLVVTESWSQGKDNALINAIKQLMDDSDLRVTLGRSAWMMGRAEHDLRENADRFRISLMKKISDSRS